MSLARAFTTRRVKQSMDLADRDGVHRSNTAKGSSIRNNISGPVRLLHTTNMLSYNAPDLNPKSAKSISSTSSRSDDDQDMFDSIPASMSSPPTSPDVPSAPKHNASPEPNHLSSYFPGANQSSPASARPEAPAIPQRAPPHTSKRSYESLPRQRSVSRMSERSQQSGRSLSTKASFSFSRSSSSSTSTSTTHQSSAPPLKSKSSSISLPSPSPAPSKAPVASHPSQLRRESSQVLHPFGKELAKVSEIAEEFGLKDRLNAVDLEEEELAAKGLRKLNPAEYLMEVDALFTTFFMGAPAARSEPAAAALWI